MHQAPRVNLKDPLCDGVPVITAESEPLLNWKVKPDGSEPLSIVIEPTGVLFSDILIVAW